jgi:hypothetical protein
MRSNVCMKDDVAGLDETELRKQAVWRLRKQRGFRTHLLVYLLVNAFLVLMWALTDRHGFFWPVWPIAFWAIFVVVNGVNSFRPQNFSETDIRKQMDRMTPS